MSDWPEFQCPVCGVLWEEEHEICPECGKTESYYVWCLHCERAFPKKHIRKGHRCAYVDCDGHWGDLIDWNQFRYSFTSHCDLPDIPITGKHYPQY